MILQSDRNAGSVPNTLSILPNTFRRLATLVLLGCVTAIVIGCGSGEPENSVVDVDATTAASQPAEKPTEESDKSDSATTDTSDSIDPINESPVTPSPTPSANNSDILSVEDTPVPDQIEPLFAGYEFELSEGDFWRFRWEWTDRSCAQGSGCKNSEDTGEFQITLGPSTEIAGVEMFELQSVGDADYVDGQFTRSFKPEWRFIGIDGHRIVVSNSIASPPTTLFDAETGSWPASSFFKGRYSEDVLLSAIPGELFETHELAGWEGVDPGLWHSVGVADSGGECSTFDGRILCPSDEQFDYTQTEHFRPGIGPFAYQYNYAASFSGGGFNTNFSTQERLVLVASSFTGDEAGDFGKPTPVPSSPTPPPEPTPIALGAPIFGPVDGELHLAPTAVEIPEFTSGVNLVAGVADTEFVNPAVSGKWSHGFIFRNSGEEIFHAVFFNSDGEWGHFARGGSLASQETLALGRHQFNRGAGERNRFTVWFGVFDDPNLGVLQINGEEVAELDLSFPAARDSGDVSAVSGFFPSDEFNGSSTSFTGFTVYEKP